MLELALRAYPPGYFEPEPSWKWMTGIVANPAYLVLRGEKAWMGAQLTAFPYAPSVRIATSLPIVSPDHAPRELLQMSGKLVAWARASGARRFFWTAVTGVDLGPLARRSGAKAMAPHYVLDL